jgi:hypothetical protein
MNFLLSINWIGLLSLAIVLLLFVVLKVLDGKINWTFVILIALALGAVVGILFSSEDGSYLVWVTLIGDVYVQIIKALVAPVILVSIIAGFISLRDKDAMKTLGFKSVFWLLAASAAAIVLSLIAGITTKIGANAASVFAGIADISSSTVNAYAGLTKPFDEVLLSLFPSNIAGDIADNNVVGIIIIAVAFAVGYVSVARKEGEENVITFKNFVLASKKIIYKILDYVIDLTPYAVLCLIASSAGTLFSNRNAMIQLALLVVLIYAVALIHTYLYNGLIVRFFGKLNPIKYFKKIASTQATAFTTQSSVGTLPVSIEELKNKVGVKEDAANFTAPLGTTIGMPGCTCIWPILLVLFYIHAAGIEWNFGNYLFLAVITLILSVGSAGVPGIAIVSAVALFNTLGLPVAAVVLFQPINSISDMARTLDNVTSANAATVVVARRQGLLDDNIFNQADETPAKTEVTE